MGDKVEASGVGKANFAGFRISFCVVAACGECWFLTVDLLGVTADMDSREYLRNEKPL